MQVRYGDDESQIAELHLPPGDGKVPVAVVIHGGFWMSSYGMELATPLAEDLARNGIAGYAIEYRRIGNGGGWPATFEDVAAAIDSLASSLGWISRRWLPSATRRAGNSRSGLLVARSFRLAPRAPDPA